MDHQNAPRNNAAEPAPGQQRGRRLLIVLGALAALGLVLTLAVQQKHVSPPPPPPALAPAVPLETTPTPVVLPPEPAPTPPAPVQEKPAAPPTEVAFERCLPRHSKLLDNQVARCRFGTPDGAPAESARLHQARGMVSAEYLARYRAERASPPARAPAGSVERTAERISHSDGKNYVAEWEVRGNRIDYGSVCGNYRQSSIEYRECRKAAGEWYREECRRRERLDSGNDGRMLERYCNAARGFNPRG